MQVGNRGADLARASDGAFAADTAIRRQLEFGSWSPLVLERPQPLSVGPQLRESVRFPRLIQL